MANLIRLECKRSKQVGLPKAIHAYLRQYYADDPNAHPEALQPDIDAIHKLRSSTVVNAKPDAHPAVLRDMLAYFCQLTFFATKFNVDIGIEFPWYPIFDSQGSAALSAALPGMLPAPSSISISSTAFDRACLLFNIAVMYNTLGASESRANTEGVKRSITLFQNAAGCFQHLQTAILPTLVFPPNQKQPVTPEFSSECLSAFTRLSLAQAQECSWQKSVLDKLKNGTIAKLSMQVSLYYSEAWDLARSAQGTPTWPVFSFPSALMTHMHVKKLQFAAIAQYRKSKDDLADSSYGAEIGRLRLAERLIREALALPKRDLSQSVLDDVKGLQAVVIDNLDRATKDNDLIYLEMPRQEKDLQPILPANLAKAAVPTEIVSPIDCLHEGAGGFGKPLFGTLVPFSVQLAMSIYDSRKEDFMQNDMVDRCDQLDAECSSSLQSLDLPAALHALDAPSGMPPSLLDKAEQVRSESGPSRIKSMLSDISRLRESNRQNLLELSGMLDSEEHEDSRLRQQIDAGSSNRLPSANVNVKYRQRIEKYWQTLEAANASDQTVLRKYESSADLIQRLGGTEEDVTSLLPAVESHQKTTWFSAPSQPSVSQHAATRKLRASLEDLDSLSASRRQICSTVKRAVVSDDIRPLVLQEAGAIADRTSSTKIETVQFEPLLERQLAKYQMYKRQLEQNGQEQAAILQRVKSENDAFTSAKTSDESQQRRQRALQAFDAAYSQYREVTANLSEGIKFYGEFGNLINNLRQECQNYVNIRRTEANQVLATLKQQTPTQIQPGLWSPDQPIRFGP